MMESLCDLVVPPLAVHYLYSRTVLIAYMETSDCVQLNIH